MILNYSCNDCGAKNELEVWQARIVLAKKFRWMFDAEVMCRQCHSHSFEVSLRSKVEIAAGQMWGFKPDMEATSMPDETIVEGSKSMKFSDTIGYFEERVAQEPENAGLLLRYGNVLRRNNLHPQAILAYEKSLALEPRLLEAAAMLAQIHFDRYKHYQLPGEQEKAVEWISQATRIAENPVFETPVDKESILGELEQMNLTVNLPPNIKPVKIPLEKLGAPAKFFCLPELEGLPDRAKPTKVKLEMVRNAVENACRGASPRDKRRALEKLAENPDSRSTWLENQVMISVKTQLAIAYCQRNKRVTLSELKGYLKQLASESAVS